MSKWQLVVCLFADSSLVMYRPTQFHPQMKVPIQFYLNDSFRRGWFFSHTRPCTTRTSLCTWWTSTTMLRKLEPTKMRLRIFSTHWVQHRLHQLQLIWFRPATKSEHLSRFETISTLIHVSHWRRSQQLLATIPFTSQTCHTLWNPNSQAQALIVARMSLTLLGCSSAWFSSSCVNTY